MQRKRWASALGVSLMAALPAAAEVTKAVMSVNNTHMS
jgi:hypothetical protein